MQIKCLNIIIYSFREHKCHPWLYRWVNADWCGESLVPVPRSSRSLTSQGFPTLPPVIIQVNPLTYIRFMIRFCSSRENQVFFTPFQNNSEIIFRGPSLARGFNFLYLLLPFNDDNNGSSKHSDSYHLVKTCYLPNTMLSPLNILSFQQFRKVCIFIHIWVS